MKKSVYFTKLVAAILLYALLLSVVGCTHKPSLPTRTEDMAQAMLDAAPHPEGRCILLNSETIKDPQTQTLLTALYGEQAVAWFNSGEGQILDEGCLYLSEALHPFEIAVFRCIDENDVTGGTSSVLGICAQRRAEIISAWQGSVHAQTAEKGMVTYMGTYVCMVIAEQPEVLIQAAKRIM